MRGRNRSTSVDVNTAILEEARTDDAYSGFCARGVANVLISLGVPCSRDDGYQWKNTLPRNGWVLLEGVRPEDAPAGAVLVFDHNHPRPDPEEDKTGRAWGHVEIVTDGDGQRRYVSDKERRNWGGSVPGNFVGAYVHPDMQALFDNGGEPLPMELIKEVAERTNRQIKEAKARIEEHQKREELKERIERDQERIAEIKEALKQKDKKNANGAASGQNKEEEKVIPEDTGRLSSTKKEGEDSFFFLNQTLETAGKGILTDVFNFNAQSMDIFALLKTLFSLFFDGVSSQPRLSPSQNTRNEFSNNKDMTVRSDVPVVQRDVTVDNELEVGRNV